MQRASSPCIQVCRLDQASGYCIGCGRTADEIMRWPQLNEAERQRIMQQDLPHRPSLLNQQKPA